MQQRVAHQSYLTVNGHSKGILWVRFGPLKALAKIFDFNLSFRQNLSRTNKHFFAILSSPLQLVSQNPVLLLLQPCSIGIDEDLTHPKTISNLQSWCASEKSLPVFFLFEFHAQKSIFASLNATEPCHLLNTLSRAAQHSANFLYRSPPRGWASDCPRRRPTHCPAGAFRGARTG